MTSAISAKAIETGVNQAASDLQCRLRNSNSNEIFPVPSNPIIILTTPTKLRRITRELKQGNHQKHSATKNPWLKFSHRTTHARQKRTPHPSQEKLEVHQLYRAQFPPTATARDRNLTAGGPLSPPTLALRSVRGRRSTGRGFPPLRPTPSPAAGDGAWGRASVSASSRRRRLRA